MNIKRIVLLVPAFAASALLLLGACSGGEVPAAPAPAESRAPDDETAAWINTEPAPEVYVVLPEAEAASDNLIFHSRGTGETPASAQPPEASSEYRDVTETVNAIAIPSVYANGGDTVSTPLRICGKVHLCAIDLRVRYDTEKLRFLDFLNTDEDIVANCDPDKGILYINYLRIFNVEDSFPLCELSFETLAADTCESALRLEIVEIVALDSEGEIFYPSFTAVDGTVYLNS